LPPGAQQLLVTLSRPVRGGDAGSREQLADSEPVDVGFLGGEQRGVTLTGLFIRGVYRVTGVRPPQLQEGSAAAAKPVWDLPLVVGGPAEESDLTALKPTGLLAIPAADKLRWIGANDQLTLAGTAVRGQNSWWWLALVTLLLLLVEMSVLLWPVLAPGSVPAPIVAR
jgi:hypothetical protein